MTSPRSYPFVQGFKTQDTSPLWGMYGGIPDPGPIGTWIDQHVKSATT